MRCKESFQNRTKTPLVPGVSHSSTIRDLRRKKAENFAEIKQVALMEKHERNRIHGAVVECLLCIGQVGVDISVRSNRRH